MSTKNRGFASFSQAKRKLISAKGGHSAHVKGVAHKFTRDEAIKAGKKSRRNHARTA